MDEKEKLYCESIGGEWEEGGEKTLQLLSGPVKIDVASGCIIRYIPQINELVKEEKHIGTNFTPGGPMGIKTKTFNAYKLDGRVIVTNHYGTELVNAKIYPNMEEFRRDYKGEVFRKYRYPLFPK